MNDNAGALELPSDNSTGTEADTASSSTNRRDAPPTATPSALEVFEYNPDDVDEPTINDGAEAAPLDTTCILPLSSVAPLDDTDSIAELFDATVTTPAADRYKPSVGSLLNENEGCVAPPSCARKR